MSSLYPHVPQEKSFSIKFVDARTGEIWRVEVEREGLRFAQIIALSRSSSPGITYIDDEQDEVTITNDDELREAVNNASSAGRRLLRVTVHHNDDARDAVKPVRSMVGTQSMSVATHIPRPLRNPDCTSKLHKNTTEASTKASVIDSLPEMSPPVASSTGMEAHSPTVPAPGPRSRVPETKTSGATKHWGVQCDVTGQMPIVGTRYHLVGKNYDLCQAAFAKLPKETQALFEAIKESRRCYTAPIAFASKVASTQPKKCSLPPRCSSTSEGCSPPCPLVFFLPLVIFFLAGKCKCCFLCLPLLFMGLKLGSCVLRGVCRVLRCICTTVRRKFRQCREKQKAAWLQRRRQILARQQEMHCRHRQILARQEQMHRHRHRQSVAAWPSRCGAPPSPSFIMYAQPHLPRPCADGHLGMNTQRQQRGDTASAASSTTGAGPSTSFGSNGGLFSAQLARLHSMGFPSNQQALHTALLEHYNGDIGAVVSLLVQ